jgi:sulfur carrier protein
MIIKVNGNQKQVSQNSTLKVLIEDLGLNDKVMAAAVNMQIIKQVKWAECILQENDSIELLDFVGGG